MRAILYARRSTRDRDERQIQSIDDQVRIMGQKAQQEGLEIVQVVTESHSAKEPGRRPEFERLLRLLDSGEAEVLLTWHLNRLFRNSVDMGAVQWRLQKGKIRRIVTAERTYMPEDNVLLFYMEAGVSNQSVLDLSVSVKRGLASKIEKGWSPHCAPPGYLNEKKGDKGRKTILKDPERFGLIRRAWDLMLSGAYTVTEIRTKLNGEWHYTSPQRSLSGGTPMARNTLHALFGNPFYAGCFIHGGKLYQGAHEPMVTWKEFTRVQQLLRREVPDGLQDKEPAAILQRKPKRKNLTYCGLLRCTDCGGQVTGHTVTKKSGRAYTYYYCQNTKRGCRKVAVREDVIDDLVIGHLDRLFVHPEFHEWSESQMREWQFQSQSSEQAGARQGQEKLEALNRQLDTLLNLKLKELITDEEFAQRNIALQNERTRLRSDLESVERIEQAARKTVANAVKFAANARHSFAEGDSFLRRAIVQALCLSNPLFTQGKVFLEPHPLLEELRKAHSELEPELRRIKPSKSTSESMKKEHIVPLMSAWSRSLDDNQTFTLERGWTFRSLDELVKEETRKQPKRSSPAMGRYCR